MAARNITAPNSNVLAFQVDSVWEMYNFQRVRVMSCFRLGPCSKAFVSEALGGSVVEEEGTTEGVEADIMMVMTDD